MLEVGIELGDVEEEEVDSALLVRWVEEIWSELGLSRGELELELLDIAPLDELAELIFLDAHSNARHAS